MNSSEAGAEQTCFRKRSSSTGGEGTSYNYSVGFNSTTSLLFTYASLYVVAL